jgi:tetratricopeptide (TPR) repeat protein
VARFEAIRRRFPHHPLGYAGHIEALSAAGDIAQALELSETAAAAFPHDLGIALQPAIMLERGQQWEAAVRRWTELTDRFPGQAGVSVGLACSLMHAGRAEEAEPVLAATLVAHPHDRGARATYAACAMRRQDWAAAEARWRELKDRYPSQPDGSLGLGELLRQTGRLDESDAVLADAVARFPDHLELQRQWAVTATAKRAWPVALDRWAALKRRYPESRGVRDGITDALWHARQDLGVAVSEGQPAPFEIPASLLSQAGAVDEDRDTLRALFMGFESLGDTCEFGMVQRRFGAEPISLLRWTSTAPEHLIQAFDTDFAGVGEPEFTRVEASAHGEYTTMDRRYHMFSHTFTQSTAAPLEKFTAQHLKRMQYLRRKLLEDVAAGEKTFVYKAERGVTDEQASALFGSLRRFGGPVRLLCVRLADAGHACGEVIAMGEGLYIGFIDRFSTVDIHVDAWVELCRKTAALQSTPLA